VTEASHYTAKQQRMLAFLAGYLGIGITELERRIVAIELEDLEGVLGVYADMEPPPSQPGVLLGFPDKGT
jgi:hypothetical protein